MKYYYDYSRNKRLLPETKLFLDPLPLIFSPSWQTLWLKSNDTASRKSSESFTESGINDPLIPSTYIYKTLYYTDWLESLSSLDMSCSGEATMFD